MEKQHFVQLLKSCALQLWQTEGYEVCFYSNLKYQKHHSQLWGPCRKEYCAGQNGYIYIVS